VTSDLATLAPTRGDAKGPGVDTIRADLDWLRDYAGVLDRGAGAASTVLDSLRAHPLTEDAFGEVGRSLRTFESYQRAADSLLGQLGKAHEVLTAAAGELRKVVEHYTGTEDDATRELENHAARNLEDGGRGR
jgi:hypothetical protein